MKHAVWDLVAVLRDPASVQTFTPERWTALLCVARAEQLLGTVALRLAGQDMPPAVARIFADVGAAVTAWHRSALWEAEMARRALAPVGVPVILMKGTAYIAAGLTAGQGRSIGDLDIMVPRAALGAVEAALLSAGWEWVKSDPYDDAYYRNHMHELPPLIHVDRDTMIDVHHTILPLTARITPDADALIASAVALPSGLSVLQPADMVLHCVAHLFADGDLAGGLRNLWDFHCLVSAFSAADPCFQDMLSERARLHGLSRPLARAMRLSHRLYNTPLIAARDTAIGAHRFSDAVFIRRLTARDGWGRGSHRITRLGFYMRAHLLRMPPMQLARHLWVKARR